ncbi:TPA: sugar ABC transporter permease [Candidatus Gastranaerophilales bacterium HUM_20]|nr:binding-protein-dependent transport systems inner membrane component [Clostridium sp. CAG:729]DAB18415.1 MAG TPA: sugar ABC transporter permease [Candidatus Gastranaerophilales bacterium HUM_20]
MKKFLDNTLNNQSFAGWVFILPALIGTFIFIIIPVICSFGLSFSKWDLLNPIQFVGLANYKEIFSEPLFYKIFWNTVVFALTTSIFGVIIPLILACILNSKIRGSEFYKTAYFLPFITPMIVIGVVWEWIFDPNIGLLNHILHLHINWLYDTHFAMPALIIVSVWKLIGYNMVIFLSSLSGISQSLFEAAKIDGATPVQTFKNVTVPLLSPTIFFVIIITAISSFQVFDLIYLMTQGGPLDSTNVLVYAIYKNAFEYFNVGKASAIAYVLFTLILVLTLIQWNLRKKLVYNEID